MVSRTLTFTAAALAMVAAVVLWRDRPAPDAAPPVVSRSASDAGQPLAGPSLPEAPAPTAAVVPARPPEPSLAAAVPLGSDQVPDLQADAAGNLVVNAHTRDELERLLALNGRVEAQALLQQLRASLPAIAYRQAVDSFYAYQNYSIAAAQLTQAAPPVADEASALRQLDALHALRSDHFGAATAQAYFGDEEATARGLIATMQAHPESGTSLSERAEQAQATSRNR